MTALSRPIVALLESALAATTTSLDDDIVRLRGALTPALQRCLAVPAASWPALVEAATARGGWDQWRSGGLLAAAHPADDEAPEATRDLLAELAEELTARGDVLAEVWEGGERQAHVESPRWIAGRERRELIFAIERAIAAALAGDAQGIVNAADNIAGRDRSGIYPALPDALRACAADVSRDRPGERRIGDGARQRLGDALAGTPFAAAVVELP